MSRGGGLAEDSQSSLAAPSAVAAGSPPAEARPTAWLGLRRWLPLLPDASWSLAANAGGVLSGLAVIKIITTLVPASEYGRASVVLGLAVLLHLFFIHPLLTAHLRVLFDHLRSGTSTAYRRRFARLLGLALAGSLGVYLVIAAVEQHRGVPVYLALLLPAALLLLVQPQFLMASIDLEVVRRFRAIALATFGSKAGQVPFLLVLLLIPLPASHAVVLSQGLALLTVVLVCRLAAPNRAEAETVEVPSGASTLDGMSGSLYVVSLCGWIMATSDRYVIQHYLGVEAVGVYAMNYALWSVPYIVLNGWLETLTRPRIYTRAAADDWHGVRKILIARTTLTTGIAVAGTALLYLLGNRIAAWLLGPSYAASTSLMLAIASAHLFFVLGNTMAPLFLAAKKPHLMLIAYLAGAGLNLGLNIVFVPRWGILAAGLSTLLSYVLWCAVLGCEAIVLSNHTRRRQAAVAGT